MRFGVSFLGTDFPPVPKVGRVKFLNRPPGDEPYSYEVLEALRAQ